MAQTMTQAKDTERRWQVRLKHETGLPLTYDGSESLTCKVWAGDDRAVYATPVCSWKTAPDLVRVTITPANLASIPLGLCKLRVYVGSSATHAAEGALRVIAAPGSAGAAKSYCTAQDMRKLFPKIDEVFDRDEDQTGFAEQLGLAREWIDECLQAAYVGHGSAIHDGGGRGPSQTLKEWLDDDKLIVSPAIRKAAASRALAEVFQGQLTAAVKGETDYGRLAVIFRVGARSLMTGTIAEIDTNGDGKGDVSIELGLTRAGLG